MEKILSLGQRKISFLLLFLLILALYVLIANAWVGDDAFITFRTVENFHQGYGLTWNTGERVQAYTHPLWMMSLSLIYFFTHELFYSSLTYSIFLMLAVLFILWSRSSGDKKPLIVAILLLLFSRYAVDFSVSGLENPLSYLLFVIYLLIFLRSNFTLKKFFILTILGSLLLLTRQDFIILLILPHLYYFLKLRKNKTVFIYLSVGAIPFVAWELFSIFYYGFFVPNTAFAKLSTGISPYQLLLQGLIYIKSSFLTDPIMLITFLYGGLVIFHKKNLSYYVIGMGVLLYLAYIIKVGGDFMAGRLLTIPFVILITIISTGKFARNKFIFLLALIMVLKLFAIYKPGIFTISDFWHNNGIADERKYYYSYTGLLPTLIDRAPDTFYPIIVARKVKKTAMSKKLIKIALVIGMYGYYSGPNVHIIDKFTLAEPLLSKLSVFNTTEWRIGHICRKIPKGYIKTIESGTNYLENTRLKEYYDKISLIIKGNLFSKERLFEIIKMNLGFYNHDIKQYSLSIKPYTQKECIEADPEF